MANVAANDLTDHGEIYPERGSLPYFGVISFIAAIGGLLFGFDTAVISGTEKFLTDQFGLTDIQLGWLVSSALVGCVIGAGIGGPLSDAFGRKRVLLLSALLFTVTGLGCAVAPSAAVITYARLIGGVGVGIASMAVPLYIAEISPPRFRGGMVSCYQLAITIGVLAAYFSNALFRELSVRSDIVAEATGLCRWMIVDEVWRAMFGAMLLPAGAFLLLLLGVPESPRWLTKQGRVVEATRILAGSAAGHRPRRPWPRSATRSLTRRAILENC